MSLHRLTRIIIGVPDVEAAAAYYRDFGLAELGANRFATVDGGEQLGIARARQRRLLQLGIGVHDTDDLDRIGSRLDKLGIGYMRNDTSMSVLDPNSSLTVVVKIAEEIKQQYTPTPATNGPGRADRANTEAGRANSAMSSSARLTKRPVTGFSLTGWASKSPITCPDWPASCDAPPTITTSWCNRRR